MDEEQEDFNMEYIGTIFVAAIAFTIGYCCGRLKRNQDEGI